MGNEYDKTFRSMVTGCQNLLLPLVNEMFGEHYTGEETVTRLQNEHFIDTPDNKQQERITDSYFRVEESNKTYHLECQSTPDSKMILRMFEYDTQIAIDTGKMKDYTITMNFPESGVLFLRSDESTPDVYRYVINTPGGTIGYPVQVLKMRQYDINEIFEKRLLFLLPFYGFVHEEYFREYEADERKRKLILAEFREITDRLSEMEQNGKISLSDSVLIRNNISQVMEKLAEKYQHVREGVDDIVVGTEYETDLIRLLNEKRLEGVEEGIEQGIEQGGVRMLFKLLEKGTITEKDAADSCGKTLQDFRKEYGKYRGVEQKPTVPEQKMKSPKL